MKISKNKIINFLKAQKLVLIIAATISLLLILIPVSFVFALQPVGGPTQTVIIPQGAKKEQIADLLKQQHIIRSAKIFLFLAVTSGTSIQAGTYTLNPADSPQKVLEALSKGEEQHITITIPEGWRREQIAQLLTEKGLDGQGFLTLTQDKEGYLFPDTYFFPKTATAQQIVDKFSRNFDERTVGLQPTREQIILASIVEREASHEDDRPVIAGIYVNRLQHNMNLDADPTVQYARDSQDLAKGETLSTFWRSISKVDYTTVTSDYNTYLHKSYPPGPICNPGLLSIAAAVHPQTTDALYFFHTPDGRLVTSKTGEEHMAKVNKYLK